MVRDAYRGRAALTLALAGGISLFAVLLAQELMIFGEGGHALILANAAPCPVVPCVTVSMVVAGHVAKAIGAALAFALIGAIWLGGAARWSIAAPVWVGLYLWSLVGIASGYRSQFGTSWDWWEPFAELLWSPAMTLGLMATGLLACVGLDRLGRAI
jgi:hypothetical protein